MNVKFSGSYKSLIDFEWNDIPMFTIITGTNGSGKTQLLELLYKKIINTPIVNLGNVSVMSIEGETYLQGEISFLKSEWVLKNSSPINLSTIQQKIQTLYEQFSQPHFSINNPKINYIFNNVAKKIGKDRGRNITQAEFEENFPIEFIEDDNLITEHIARIFIDYHISRAEEILKDKSENELTKEIGPKPWILLNEIMKEANLPFEFNNPESTGLKNLFKLEIKDIARNINIEFDDLSSGEKVLVSLVFFLYTSQEKKNVFPKFLLLDEPDAHLHPSMAKQFLDVVNNVFVKRHNIRVIMTTHSPSTVALAPEESLFEMNRIAPRITKSISKNRTISLLTAGLVIVGQGTKYYLVEDNADVEFYQNVYSYFTANGFISGIIPLVFIPASTTSKSGGKGQVYDWVEKLFSSGLANIIQGIVDKDNGNPASNGIYVLNRYSFENYLLDPLIVYAALMDMDIHPRMEGIVLNLGEEYKLKKLSNAELQQIADKIYEVIEPQLGNEFKDFQASEMEKENVELVTGHTIKYPKWLLNRRGKSLIKIYNQTFSSIHPTSLMKAFKKTYFLPKEIQLFFQKLES